MRVLMVFQNKKVNIRFRKKQKIVFNYKFYSSDFYISYAIKHLIWLFQKYNIKSEKHNLLVFRNFKLARINTRYYLDNGPGVEILNKIPVQPQLHKAKPLPQHYKLIDVDFDCVEVEIDDQLLLKVNGDFHHVLPIKWTKIEHTYCSLYDTSLRGEKYNISVFNNYLCLEFDIYLQPGCYNSPLDPWENLVIS